MSDSREPVRVELRLQPGEYVINGAAARELGLDALRRLMNPEDES